MEKKFDETQNEVKRVGGLIPLDLQFYAEGDEPPVDDPEPQLTAEEQLEQMRVEMLKIKKAQEKAASEAAEYKKKYSATLSEAEKKKQEEAEKKVEQDEEIKRLRRENTVNKWVKNYLKLGYADEMAEEAAAAQYDGDSETMLRLQAEHQASLLKQEQAKWLKSRPTPKIGTGEGGDTDVTREQFNRMGYRQRVEFKAKYPDVYKSYTNNGGQ